MGDPSEKLEVFERWNDTVDGTRPRLKLTVPALGDVASLELSWSICEADASCWKRPLTLTISPELALFKPDDMSDEVWRKACGAAIWETVVDLSREEMRLIRDFLTSLLASPDLRDD